MTRSLKLVGLIFLILTFTVGCTKMRRGSADSAPGSADDAIASAEAAIKKAKAVNWIWRDTEKMLKAAKEAKKKGDKKKAKKLAIAAKEQAVLAVKQYNLEKKMDRSLGKK